MMYNVPENEEENEEMLKCKIVNEIYIQYIGVENITPKDVYRIGKGNKPRLVLVKFNSKEHQVKVLKKAKELRKCEKKRPQESICKTSMTTKEREKKVLDELKKRRDEGENNLILVDGKIVTRRQPLQNAEGTKDQRMQRQNTTGTVDPNSQAN